MILLCVVLSDIGITRYLRARGLNAKTGSTPFSRLTRLQPNGLNAVVKQLRMGRFLVSGCRLLPRHSEEIKRPRFQRIHTVACGLRLPTWEFATPAFQLHSSPSQDILESFVRHTSPFSSSLSISSSGLSVFVSLHRVYI